MKGVLRGFVVVEEKGGCVGMEEVCVDGLGFGGGGVDVVGCLFVEGGSRSMTLSEGLEMFGC